jgi:hypothetical protein
MPLGWKTKNRGKLTTAVTKIPALNAPNRTLAWTFNEALSEIIPPSTKGN